MQCLKKLPLIFLGACASQSYLASKGHQAFSERNYVQAAELFGESAQQPSSNQLLFMLDQGSALFAARKYKEAIEVFLRAEKIAEIKDYTSISEEVGVLATSSNVRGYKGEDFEKVLINVYLALSYAALGNVEDAQVEARKINLILYRMIHEGKRNYEESPFARYLSGILWEMSGAHDEAYIDYKKTYELDPSFYEIGRDLLASAARNKIYDEQKEWEKLFPSVSPRYLKRNQGELIVVFEQGLSPVKVPRGSQDGTLPEFSKRFAVDSSAHVLVDGASVGETQKVLDVESLSIRYLEDRISRMMAAKLAGVALKGAVAAGVGKASDNPDLGIAVFQLLLVMDRADLRSWRSLPGSIQLLRIPVEAGRHHFRVEVLGALGGKVLATKDFGEIETRAGMKQFLIVR